MRCFFSSETRQVDFPPRTAQTTGRDTPARSAISFIVTAIPGFSFYDYSINYNYNEKFCFVNSKMKKIGIFFLKNYIGPACLLKMADNSCKIQGCIVFIAESRK